MFDSTEKVLIFFSMSVFVLFLMWIYSDLKNIKSLLETNNNNNKEELILETLIEILILLKKSDYEKIIYEIKSEIKNISQNSEIHKSGFEAICNSIDGIEYVINTAIEKLNNK